jgi:hypothetical protein
VPSFARAAATHGRAALALCIALIGSDGYSAEGGIGVYLLGSRGPMAGFTPPPGV